MNDLDNYHFDGWWLRATRPHSFSLFAAGATFTLIAWGFSYLYLICQILIPQSFIGGTNPGQPRSFLGLLFLSFTTLSATGSGDILPMGSAARVLVMLDSSPELHTLPSWSRG